MKDYSQLSKVAIICLRIWHSSVAVWHFDWSIVRQLINQNVTKLCYRARGVNRWSRLKSSIDSFSISDVCIFWCECKFYNNEHKKAPLEWFKPIVRTCSKIFLNDTGHYLLIYLVGRIVWDVQTVLQSFPQDYVWN